MSILVHDSVAVVQPDGAHRAVDLLGATPEINTSLIIFSVAFPKGLSLVQWIFTGNVLWTFSGIFRISCL